MLALAKGGAIAGTVTEGGLELGRLRTELGPALGG